MDTGGASKWMPGMVPLDPITMQQVSKIAGPDMQKALNPIGAALTGTNGKQNFLGQWMNQGFDYGAKKDDQQRQAADDDQRNRVSVASQ